MWGWVVALDFVGLGSTLKCDFGDEFEAETDEVDEVNDFGGIPRSKFGNRGIPEHYFKTMTEYLTNLVW